MQSCTDECSKISALQDGPGNSQPESNSKGQGSNSTETNSNDKEIAQTDSDDNVNSDDDENASKDSDSNGINQSDDKDSKGNNNNSASTGDDNGDDYEGDQLDDYDSKDTTSDSKTGGDTVRDSDVVNGVQNDKQPGSSEGGERVYVSQMHALHGWAALGSYGPVLLLVGLVIIVGAGFAWSYRLQIVRGWQQWQTVAQSDELEMLRTDSVSDLLKHKPSQAQTVISVKAGLPS
jgi:hypothetical protein